MANTYDYESNPQLGDMPYDQAEQAAERDHRFARCVHGIGGSGHQHGHGHCDGPQTDPILSVVRYGGHSRITYRWRGGVVSDEGPAGRTAERVAAIIERGDA